MNSPISVKPIDDGLDLEQPFDEREVRDSECLVYYSRKVERFSGFFLLWVILYLLVYQTNSH